MAPYSTLRSELENLIQIFETQDNEIQELEERFNITLLNPSFFNYRNKAFGLLERSIQHEQLGEYYQRDACYELAETGTKCRCRGSLQNNR